MVYGNLQSLSIPYFLSELQWVWEQEQGSDKSYLLQILFDDFWGDVERSV